MIDKENISNDSKTLEIGESDLFSAEELAIFHQALSDAKENLIAKAKHAMKSGSIKLDTNEMMDEVDLASATVEQNLTFRLLDRERKLLHEIDHALKKIKSGDYGYCEGTGEPIPKRRLELAPWTRHSVKHKEYLEKMKKSGRGLGDDEDSMA
jgi:DnaK suppressor protein